MRGERNYYLISVTKFRSEAAAEKAAILLYEDMPSVLRPNYDDDRLGVEFREEHLTVAELEKRMQSVLDRLRSLNEEFLIEAYWTRYLPPLPTPRYINYYSDPFFVNKEVWSIATSSLEHPIHRLTGPAMTRMDPDGQTRPYWCINGRQCEPFDHLIKDRSPSTEAVMEYLSLNAKHFRVIQALYDEGIIDLDETVADNLKIGL